MWHWILPGLQWIAADPKNPKVFYVSGDKNVYQTSDGQNFTPIGGPHKNGWLTVDSQGRLLLAAEQTERSGLWRYEPQKKSWTRLLDENWVGYCAVDPTNPNRIAVATNQNSYSENSAATGVWISADGGKTWSQQNKGLAMLRGLVIAFKPARLGAGSIWYVWARLFSNTLAEIVCSKRDSFLHKHAGRFPVCRGFMCRPYLDYLS